MNRRMTEDKIQGLVNDSWDEVNPLRSDAVKISVTDEASSLDAAFGAIKARKLYRSILRSKKRYTTPLWNKVMTYGRKVRRILEVVREVEELYNEKNANYLFSSVGKLLSTGEAPLFLKTDKKVSCSAGTVSLRLYHAFEVLDWTMVPHKYMKVDDRKVMNAIALGEKEIPGLRIYLKPKMAITIEPSYSEGRDEI